MFEPLKRITMTDRPIDLTNQLALVDVGPATPPPSWCLPDAEPEWSRRTDEHGGGQFCTWDRMVDGELWVGCRDEIVESRVLRSQPRIFGTEEPGDGWTVAQARELARQLLAAADLVDQAVSR